MKLSCTMSIGSRRCLWLCLAPLILCGSFAVEAAQAKQINFKSVYGLAELASAAYEPAAALKKRKGAAHVGTPGPSNVQYALFVNGAGKSQTITVRGTIDDTNWELNMETAIVPDKKAGIMLHQGYRKIAQELYADLKPRLKAGYPVTLTGHSLGGAVAVILGMYLQRDKVKVSRIYTFGQPRITDKKGAKAYAGLPLLRIVHQNDVASLFPAKSDPGDKPYASLGPVVNLLAGPHYLYVGAKQLLKLWKDKKLVSNIRAQFSVPDHKMKFYLSNLRYKLEGAELAKLEDRTKLIDRQRRTPLKRKNNFNTKN